MSRKLNDSMSLEDEKKNIDKLKQETIILKDELQHEKHTSSMAFNNQSQKIKVLQDQAAYFMKLNEMELKKQKDLEEEIEKMDQLVLEKRQKLYSDSAAEVPQMTKTIHKLEYKLEQLRQKHNTLLDEIKSQKEDINVLRRDRVIFDNVFKDLEKDLKRKEEHFKKVIFEFVQVQQEKEIAEDELDKIKKESEKEVNHFSNQYNKAFENGEDRVQTYGDEPPIRNKDEKLHETGILKPRKDKKELSSLLRIKKAESSVALADNTKKQELEKFNLVHDKLKKEANVKNIDEFIEIYKSQEGINNDLFSHSIDLNDEIGLLEQQMNQVNDEIKKYSSLIDNNDIVLATENITLINGIKETRDKNSLVAKKNQEIISNLNLIIKQIPSALQQLNNYVSDNDNENINVWNLQNFMGLLEEKMDRIVDFSKNEEKVNYEERKSPQKKKKNNDKENLIEEILEGIEKCKESEKIMGWKEFEENSNKEILKFMSKSPGAKSKKKR